MKKVIVLGVSGSCMVAASVAMKLPDVEFLGFLENSKEPGDTVGEIRKLPVLGHTDDIDTFLKQKDTYFFCAYEGIRDPHMSYGLWKELPIPRDRYITLIDPMAVIPEGFVQVGAGVLAAPFVQVSPDAIISDNVMLLGNAFVGHNSFIGEFSHVTTNSVVGAFVHVGKGVTVGMNSTLLGRVHVGDFTLIGAGSMVTKDVPGDVIIAGNPAKVLRVRESGGLNYLKKGERNVNY